jgi:hypothetical protein
MSAGIREAFCEQARIDQAVYAAGMRRGDHRACLAVERRYDLDGWPPELVSVGLQAAAEGRPIHEAIEAYLAREQTS